MPCTILLDTAGQSAGSGAAADTTNPAVAVNAPNGTESWAAGSAHNITWSATDAGGFGANPIKIEYSLNNGGSWTTITAAAPNTGTFAWTLPQAVSTSALVRVTATDAAGNVGTDVSNAVFTIVDSTVPTVAVVTPNGAESWNTGDTNNVVFTASDNIGVNGGLIHLSTDGGATYTILLKTMNTAEAQSGSVAVNVPYSAGVNRKIRVTISDAAGNSTTDASDAVFTIVNVISISVIGTLKTEGSVLSTVSKSANLAAGDIVAVGMVSDGAIESTDWNGHSLIEIEAIEYPVLGGRWLNILYWPSTETALADVVINFSAEEEVALLIYVKIQGGTASPLDKHVIANGASASPSSGNTSATAQAKELIVGFIVDQLTAGGTVNVGAAGGSMADLTSIASTDGSIKLVCQWKRVTSTGVQAASRSGASTLGEWAAMASTFKEA